MRETLKYAVVSVVIVVCVVVFGAYQNHSDVTTVSYCDEETISYESIERDSPLIQSGDNPVVQLGTDGIEKICYNKNHDEISREIVRDPIEEITLHGTADVPQDASNEFVEEDYRKNWQQSGGQITRNFAQETRNAYYKQLQDDPEEELYYSIRSGAICNDGSYSYATGRGACSWHGGVREWLYE